MQATFYKCVSTPLKINKTFDVQTENKNIKLLKNCDIFNFQIVVSDFNLNYNYVYIERFNRYYFITNYEIQNNGLYILTLKIDVLYTYKNQISSANLHIVRSNVPIGDNIEYVPENNLTVLTQNIINPFKNAYSDVLITMRG